MKIELKKITKDDLELLMNWRMKPNITKYMYTDCCLTMDKQLLWYDKIKSDPNGIYWVVICDGNKIGELSIQKIDLLNKKCTWGYSIGEDSATGKGIARILECNMYEYVFNKLKLNKVWCEVFTFNKKVINIHEKFGCKIEGILKDHIYKNGQYYDVATMGITKDMWNKIRNTIKYDKAYIED